MEAPLFLLIVATTPLDVFLARRVFRMSTVFKMVWSFDQSRFSTKSDDESSLEYMDSFKYKMRYYKHVQKVVEKDRSMFSLYTVSLQSSIKTNDVLRRHLIQCVS